MATTIKKPISRDYTLQTFRDFEEYALYVTTKNVKVIDTPENYEITTSSDPDALLVIDDSSATPSAGEVGLSTVQAFISTVAVGDYVKHIEEVYHYEDVRNTKYALRLGTDLTDDEIDDMFDAEESTVKAYKSLIQDTLISTSTLWSSSKIDTLVNSTKADAKTYIDKLFGESATIKLKVVTALPTTGDTGTLYIYDDGTSYPIYIYTEEDGWKQTGADLSHLDLSGYVKTTSIVTDTTTVSDDTILSSKAAKTYADSKFIYSELEPTDPISGSVWIG